MKKLTRVFTAALLALAMVLPLAGCGAAPADPAEEAKAAVAQMFEAIKALDFETAGKYVDTDELIGADELAGLPDGVDFLNGMLGKLQYEIVSAQPENEETVYVTTKVSAVDMKPVFTQFMAKIMEYVMAHAFDDPAPTEEEITKEVLNIFGQLLSADGLAMVTEEVLLKVVKADSGWMIETSDELVDAMLGGLEEAAEEFANALG